ncbi:MAG: hypothetical protein ACTHNN_10295 [Xanthobacteraceae bacterium]
MTDLTVTTPHSHSMHMFGFGSQLRIWDMTTGIGSGNRMWNMPAGKQWSWNGKEFVPVKSISYLPFHAYGYDFRQERGAVNACDGGRCKSIKIKEGTWSYDFAAANGAVIAVTNYGDALLFRDGNWCRMSRRDDTYRCDPNEPIVLEPRQVQFYSSIRFKGKTLLGEWPTGRIYEFDGKKLRPTDNQPPFATGKPIGYEAQTLAVFCNDLYVGYWPTGEIWRLRANEWSRAVALFPPPRDTNTFIPYRDRTEPAPLDGFYGRRVTALVPHNGSLFAATSNLRDWGRDYTSPILSSAEAEKYGAIYRLDVKGCSSVTN